MKAEARKNANANFTWSKSSAEAIQFHKDVLQYFEKYGWAAGMTSISFADESICRQSGRLDCFSICRQSACPIQSFCRAQRMFPRLEKCKALPAHESISLYSHLISSICIREPPVFADWRSSRAFSTWCFFAMARWDGSRPQTRGSSLLVISYPTPIKGLLIKQSLWTNSNPCLDCLEFRVCKPMIPMIVGSGSMVLCQCLWWSSVTVRPLTCELCKSIYPTYIHTNSVRSPLLAGWHGCETSGSCGIMWDLVSEVVFLSALDLCNTAGPGEVASSWSSLDTSAFHRSGEHGQNPRISWRYSFFFQTQGF